MQHRDNNYAADTVKGGVDCLERGLEMEQFGINDQLLKPLHIGLVDFPADHDHLTMLGFGKCLVGIIPRIH